MRQTTPLQTNTCLYVLYFRETFSTYKQNGTRYEEGLKCSSLILVPYLHVDIYIIQRARRLSECKLVNNECADFIYILLIAFSSRIKRWTKYSSPKSYIDSPLQKRGSCFLHTHKRKKEYFQYYRPSLTSTIISNSADTHQINVLTRPQLAEMFYYLYTRTY